MKFHDILLEVIYGFSIAASAGEIKNKKNAKNYLGFSKIRDTFRRQTRMSS